MLWSDRLKVEPLASLDAGGRWMHFAFFLFKISFKKATFDTFTGNKMSYEVNKYTKALFFSHLCELVV